MYEQTELNHYRTLHSSVEESLVVRGGEEERFHGPKYSASEKSFLFSKTQKSKCGLLQLWWVIWQQGNHDSLEERIIKWMKLPVALKEDISSGIFYIQQHRNMWNMKKECQCTCTVCTWTVSPTSNYCQVSHIGTGEELPGKLDLKLR